MRLANGALATKLPKKPSASSKITPEQCAAMIALAEVLRDIFLCSQPEATEDHRTTLTGRGKLLLQ